MEDWQIRIERKIDQLSEAVISMARMEERMISLFKRMDVYDERQMELGRRLGDVEKTQAGRAWVERFLWMIVAAIVAGTAYFK